MSFNQQMIRTKPFRYGGSDPHYMAIGACQNMPAHIELFEMIKAGIELATAAEYDAGTSHKTAWFGTCGITHSGDIQKRAGKVRKFLDEHITTFTFRCSNSTNDIAFYMLKERDNVEGGRPLHMLPRSAQICLGRGFYDGRNYCWGEKVLSILHEITHMTIGTEDVSKSYNTDKKYYGFNNCRVLVNQSPEKALRNADNWAYFFGSYHDQTTARSRNWGQIPGS